MQSRPLRRDCLNDPKKWAEERDSDKLVKERFDPSAYLCHCKPVSEMVSVALRDEAACYVVEYGSICCRSHLHTSRKLMDLLSDGRQKKGENAGKEAGEMVVYTFQEVERATVDN
jgi:hypothetical protein